MDGYGVYGAVEGRDYLPGNHVVDFKAKEVDGSREIRVKVDCLIFHFPNLDYSLF